MTVNQAERAFIASNSLDLARQSHFQTSNYADYYQQSELDDSTFIVVNNHTNSVSTTSSSHIVTYGDEIEYNDKENMQPPPNSLIDSTASRRHGSEFILESQSTEHYDSPPLLTTMTRNNQDPTDELGYSDSETRSRTYLQLHQIRTRIKRLNMQHQNRLEQMKYDARLSIMKSRLLIEQVKHASGINQNQSDKVMDNVVSSCSGPLRCSLYIQPGNLQTR